MDTQLNQAMNEAEGVNLQIFRLQEIKKVAENIRDLRGKRDKAKVGFESNFQKLDSVNQQISKYQKMFDKISINLDL